MKGKKNNLSKKRKRNQREMEIIGEETWEGRESGEREISLVESQKHFNFIYSWFVSITQ